MEMYIPSKKDLEEIISRSVEKAFQQKAQPLPKQEELYTKKETRSKLKCSMPTIDRWSAQGILNRIQIGNRVYFSAKDVENLMKSNG